MKVTKSWKTEGNDNPAETLSTVGSVTHVSDGIFVRVSGYYCKILYADILWLGAYNNYCEIHQKNGKTLCVILPLVKVEKRLPSASFVRIHRSFIINVHEVDRFIGNMVYIGKQSLDVSRPYRKSVFGCFDILKDYKSESAGE